MKAKFPDAINYTGFHAIADSPTPALWIHYKLQTQRGRGGTVVASLACLAV